MVPCGITVSVSFAGQENLKENKKRKKKKKASGSNVLFMDYI